MGLLDQVLGSVLGSRPGGGMTGGGLDGRSGGGMSPLMMAVLALLAQKAMSQRGSAGGLGDLLGGGSGGLGGLLDSFNRSGHGEIANSWVGPGENRSIAPGQLADALGPDTVDELSQQTGMPQQDLLSQLSHVLPGVVDQLTPQGRLPREDELDRY
ncbi:MAG TPA: YidB family protein [Microvirga sp.]|nr:YidB family protein [Microvirga sp.]